MNTNLIPSARGLWLIPLALASALSLGCAPIYPYDSGRPTWNGSSATRPTEKGGQVVANSNTGPGSPDGRSNGQSSGPGKCATPDCKVIAALPQEGNVPTIIPRDIQLPKAPQATTANQIVTPSKALSTTVSPSLTIKGQAMPASKMKRMKQQGY